MLRRNYNRRTISSISPALRYIIAVGASVLLFSIFGIAMIYQPNMMMTVLTVLLPVGMLLLGGLWALMRLPWYLSFLPPGVLFIVFSFLRLNGFPSLIYLLGYIPICLAGALVVYSLLRYLQTRHVFAAEAEETDDPVPPPPVKGEDKNE